MTPATKKMAATSGAQELAGSSFARSGPPTQRWTSPAAVEAARP